MNLCDLTHIGYLDAENIDSEKMCSKQALSNSASCKFINRYDF